MFRLLKLFVVTILATACLGKVWSEDAQPPAAQPSKIPVTTKLEKGKITFSWPVRHGSWGLYEQQSSLTGKWTVVGKDLQHTNAATVSISLPVPDKTTFYQVKRVFQAPPMPSLLTPKPKPAKIPPSP